MLGARTLVNRSVGRAASRGFANGKDIKFGFDARALMLAGVDQLADAVQLNPLKVCCVVCDQFNRSRC